MIRRFVITKESRLYPLSLKKNILKRKLKDLIRGSKFAKHRSGEKLPVLVYKHNSLIRRRLGNVNMEWQEGKAINLAISAPKITGIIVRPGEVFSFWRLVGPDNAKNGYKEGLTIAGGKPSNGVGGGMCQFTNLIHWMILHSELTIIEHHHHDGLDLFPDFGRKVPFGTGTSVFYNYLDYRFRNDTDNTYQLIVYTDDEYLYGELRCAEPQRHKIHIRTEDEHFSRENGTVYRNGRVVRNVIDPKSGNTVKSDVIRNNHAKVMYDTSHLEVIEK